MRNIPWAQVIILGVRIARAGETRWPFTMSVSRCGADKEQPKCNGIAGSQEWSSALAGGGSGQIVSRMRGDPESNVRKQSLECEGDLTMNTSHCCMDNSGINPRVVSCDFSTGEEGDVPLKAKHWELIGSSQIKNTMYDLCLGVGGGLDVYAGPLASGRYTAVLLNRSPVLAEITVNFTDLFKSGIVGVSPAVWCATCYHSVRDVLAHKDLGQHSGSFSAKVRSHAVVHLVIEPKGTAQPVLKSDDAATARPRLAFWVEGPINGACPGWGMPYPGFSLAAKAEPSCWNNTLS